MRDLEANLAGLTDEQLKTVLSERNAYVIAIKARMKEEGKVTALRAEEGSLRSSRSKLQTKRRTIERRIARGIFYDASVEASENSYQERHYFGSTKLDSNVREEIRVALREYAKEHDMKPFPPGRVFEFAKGLLTTLVSEDSEVRDLAMEEDEIAERSETISDLLDDLEQPLRDAESAAWQIKSFLSVPREQRVANIQSEKIQAARLNTRLEQVLPVLRAAIRGGK